VRDDDTKDDETNQRGPTPADLAAMLRTNHGPSSRPSPPAPPVPPVPPGRPAAEPEVVAPLADARKRVVIAEDEALIRLDLKETLDELGYDGPVALAPDPALFKGQKRDAIVSTAPATLDTLLGSTSAEKRLAATGQ